MLAVLLEVLRTIIKTNHLGFQKGLKVQVNNGVQQHHATPRNDSKFL
jgi:hypothetical protein